MSSPDPEPVERSESTDHGDNAKVAKRKEKDDTVRFKMPRERSTPPIAAWKDMAPMEASHDFEIKEEDRWLPFANVARIMRGALPENVHISKGAKECMQECVSEFISIITSEAAEKTSSEKRKTINGDDILFAMYMLGFENYGEILKIYLSRYRETLQQNRSPGAAEKNT